MEKAMSKSQKKERTKKWFDENKEFIEEGMGFYETYTGYNREYSDLLKGDTIIDKETYEYLFDLWVDLMLPLYPEATKQQIFQYQPWDEDWEEDMCVANPPYYCDGGCGKKVGEGNDHDCKRVCEDCEEKEYRYEVIARYSHDDKDHQYKTLDEAKQYCKNFNLIYDNIQRLHYIDGEWCYENDWYDEEWE